MEYYNTPKRTKIEWMRHNVLSEFATGISMYIQKNLPQLRSLTYAGLYFLHEIPECNPCFKNCGYHKFCDKVSYEDMNYSQRFFGKTKLLIKNKPKVTIK